MARERRIHYVVFHRPGPAWQMGLDFMQQPGVMDHAGYYAGLVEQGVVRMGGPLLAQDRGGMMVCSLDVTQEEAEAFAAADPAIKAGLLTYEVLPWYVAMEVDD